MASESSIQWREQWQCSNNHTQMFVCFFNISDHVKLKRKTLVNVFRFKHQCVVFKLHSTGATDVTSLLHLVLKILIDNYSRFFFYCGCDLSNKNSDKTSIYMIWKGKKHDLQDNAFPLKEL